MVSYMSEPPVAAEVVTAGAPREPSGRAAHVIVVGNEKGGSGKSTLAVHLIVALLKDGRRVASIDTDSRQLSLTRYLENRARWARRTGLPLDQPTHFSVGTGAGKAVADVEAHEFAAFSEIVERVGSAFDVVVIDTPGNDSYRMRLSHGMADTIVTPVNDSLVDLDVLGQLDPAGEKVAAVSQYADLAMAARHHRAAVLGHMSDWIVVRNRIAPLASRNQRRVVTGLELLRDKLGFRLAEGVTERLIFRELFAMGLTVFDTLDKSVLGTEPTMSHLAARREIRDLVAALKLPQPVRAPVAGGAVPVEKAVAAAAR